MNERQKVLYSSFQNTEEGKKELYEYTKKKITETSGPSNFNSLTNLPALRYFFYLTGEIVRERPEQNYAVIVMDITQFKAVNEFLGRSEGDRLLCFIGDILLEYAQNRADTVAGHVRADNFCLFTSWTDRQELIDIALDLKNKVAELPFAYRVILSIGICASEEREPAVNYLKDCATIAMSEIKGKYYADYNFFTENMRTDILRDKRVENDIVDALEHDNIIPFIQPKVDMVTGKIVLKHLLAMLTELGVKIIAEGVETKEQRDFLVENGCRVAQGFYYHRPMPVDEFDELLKKQV